ncbi:MAG: hypothetical protein NTW28_00095 [Candidatus Solibacter sp.]|nr:hypothetical protein [Candidatus Solibacter sp.]
MKSLCIGLSFLIAFPPLHAQLLPTELNIVVVEGEGAINNVRQRVARAPVVRVEDQNHKPIAGAAVVFTLPTEGATGEFSNGGKSLTMITDNQGLAAAQSLRLNQMAGKVPIHVNASYRGLTARTSITQFSVLPPGAKASSSTGGGHGGLIAVLVVLGAAAAGGGAYFATHKTSSSSGTVVTPPTPVAIGITPGTGSIAGGR